MEVAQVVEARVLGDRGHGRVLTGPAAHGRFSQKRRRMVQTRLVDQLRRRASK